MLLLRTAEPGNDEPGSMKFEYEKELTIEQDTINLLGKVDHALERVAAGQFGVCEGCGNSLPLERLDVLPHTALCVTCAQKN